MPAPTQLDESHLELLAGLMGYPEFDLHLLDASMGDPQSPQRIAWQRRRGPALIIGWADAVTESGRWTAWGLDVELVETSPSASSSLPFFNAFAADRDADQTLAEAVRRARKAIADHGRTRRGLGGLPVLRGPVSSPAPPPAKDHQDVSAAALAKPAGAASGAPDDGELDDWMRQFDAEAD
ncbi:MAG: hypothetical protein AAF958_10805 [Planctomycetota bacterium]